MFNFFFREIEKAFFVRRITWKSPHKIEFKKKMKIFFRLQRTRGINRRHTQSIIKFDLASSSDNEISVVLLWGVQWISTSLNPKSALPNPKQQESYRSSALRSFYAVLGA